MAWTTTTTRATGFTVTAAVWNAEHVQNLKHLEQVAYVEFTSDVSISATTVGGANQIVSSGAITYENVPHLIEFFAVRYTVPAVQTFFILRDGTTVLGTIARMPTTGSASPILAVRRLTPTAASHTYNVAAWNQSAGTGTVEAGTGGTAGDATTDMPGYIRITRVVV